MKAFAIYTGLRLALFLACYVVLGGLYFLAFGSESVLLWPFLAAVVVSSLLSLKYLAPQREAFAAVVDARAHKAAARFEERRAREDVD
ncbi:MAG: DUF4229 domain-containing protein [Marmoricola sp.]